jgi:hypothetical protein
MAAGVSDVSGGIAGLSYQGNAGLSGGNSPSEEIGFGRSCIGIWVMTTRDVIAEFDRLVGEAEALTDDLERDREPEFEAVLADVLAHPAERAALALEFIEMLRSSADSDLLEFCKHELRWSEAQGQVEAAMHEAANNGDRRLQFGPGGVLPSFRDGWLDGRGGGYKRFA